MFQTNQMIVLGFLGQSGVGKTHLIHRYLINSIPEKHGSTIAVQFMTGFYKMQDGTKLKVKFWDTSGQQKYKQIVCYHLKQSQCIIIVFDLTNYKSFDQIDQWFLRLQKQGIQNKLIIVIGNKNDLNSSRRIDRQRAYSKTKQYGGQYYQLNSYNSEQVKQTFSEIIEMIIERKAQQQIRLKQQQKIKQEQKYIKLKQQILPSPIQQSSSVNALCSNCLIY